MNTYRLKHIFSRMPNLETTRLTLRRMTPKDAPDMYEYACRESVTRYLLWSPHPDENSTRRYLEQLQDQYKSGDFYDWAITLTENGKMIGTCGYTEIDLQNERGEVGYVLNPDYWGQGIACEAVMAVLEYGFTSLGLYRIEAHYIIGNDRSRRVMEKCGMTFEGILRSFMLIKGEHRDIGICAITKPDYMSKFGTEKKRFARWRDRLF